MKLLSVVTLAMAVSLVACGGGGSRKIVGRECPAGDYQIFPKDLNDSQIRIELDPNLNQIPVGKYTYEGSTLYYVDNSDLRIEAIDVKQKDGKFNSTTSCLRNPKSTFSPVSVDSVRAIVLDSSKKYAVEVNKMSINIEATVFKVTTASDPKNKLESPKEAYKGATEAFMVGTKGNNTNYEIRSSGTTASGRYMLQVRLTRTDN